MRTTPRRLAPSTAPPPRAAAPRPRPPAPRPVRRRRDVEKLQQRNVTAKAGAEPSDDARTAAVLAALATIPDPDLGVDIVTAGFVKGLTISNDGAVAFTLELTTPACPVKEEFRSSATAAVSALPWATSVAVTMSAAPPPPAVDGDDDESGGRPGGLARVRHVVAVSSCKGGVGKSTVAVNLAFTLAQMGAKVGLLDADVYGPSLPTMAAPPGGPADAVLAMDPDTRALTPVDVHGVACVSFGWAGQGAAIMRGPMVSGLIAQLATTTEWGALDYLVIDFPPGTGDIQLTLCQTIQFSAAVIVTTPAKLSYVDVAKGVRMFARVAVPCVAVAENMATFTGDDGTVYRPFGAGAGDRIQAEFGVPHVVRFPIEPALAAAGDEGTPLVVSDPAGATAGTFMELGGIVVREVARLEAAGRASVSYDPDANVLLYTPAGSPLPPVPLPPAAVRAADRSAAAIDEWTGAPVTDAAVSPDVRPVAVQTVGNYAAQISWDDGFSQVAPYDQLDGLADEARLAAARGEEVAV